MISLGYSLSVKDNNDLNNFKKSAAYGSYLKAISMSPAFRLIMKEHIDNVDVSEDIKYLINTKKLPENINPKTLSDLFRDSLSKMAIGITADSILLKELENINLDEALLDLTNHADVEYLLGKADKKYYEQASKMLQEDKLEENSIIYRGLIEYLKKNKISMKEVKKQKEKEKPKVIEQQLSDDTIEL
ncbi:MAG: hypothetical protein M0R17_03135 [Candidatus Omnitrophica bacterium]|jgi:hypothetical protein|nr:hypothetical protein [Candidatus Omnitrophota bacterium]